MKIQNGKRRGGEKSGRPGSIFRQIAKGDLVAIHDQAGERKGHAARREHGRWVLVLERNMGTALATSENTISVSKPKRLMQPPKVGDKLVYDDGRKRTGKVVEAGPRSMYVIFESSMEPTLINFDDPQWMDYIAVL